MPAIGTTYPMTFTYADYGGETSTVAINISATSANTLAELEVISTELSAAISAVSKGALRKREYGPQIVVSNLPAADKDAQRELKLLITMRGATSEKLYTLSIPVADPTALNFGVGDDVLIGDGASTDVAALVVALNANARANEPSGEALSVIRARLVGRNI